MRHRLVHVCDDNSPDRERAERDLRELIATGWYYTRNERPPSLMGGEPLVGIGSHGGRGLFILGTVDRSADWQALNPADRYKWRIKVEWDRVIQAADPDTVLDGITTVHGRRPNPRSWSSIGTPEYDAIVERLRAGSALVVSEATQVPQFWLKPLGVTTPPSPMPNDWTVDADLDSYALRTGPNTPRQPPQMGPGDRILFHAVIHGRVFAEGEILDIPRWKRDPVWDLRWPWVYPCGIDMWVPLIEDGPRTSDIAPRRAVGRIQAGGDFASLSREEYTAVASALAQRPNVVRRADSEQITRG